MIEAIIKGFTLGLVLSISVGPVLFTIIKQSLNNGHKGGLAFVFGVSASDVSMVLLVNLFTELFAEFTRVEFPYQLNTFPQFSVVSIPPPK